MIESRNFMLKLKFTNWGKNWHVGNLIYPLHGSHNYAGKSEDGVSYITDDRHQHNYIESCTPCFKFSKLCTALEYSERVVT